MRASARPARSRPVGVNIQRSTIICLNKESCHSRLFGNTFANLAAANGPRDGEYAWERNRRGRHHAETERKTHQPHTTIRGRGTADAHSAISRARYFLFERSPAGSAHTGCRRSGIRSIARSAAASATSPLTAPAARTETAALRFRPRFIDIDGSPTQVVAI